MAELTKEQMEKLHNFGIQIQEEVKERHPEIVGEEQWEQVLGTTNTLMGVVSTLWETFSTKKNHEAVLDLLGTTLYNAARYRKTKKEGRGSEFF